MIERVLTGDIATAEAFDDALEAPLYPAEAAHVAKAVPKRVNEFATVRRCARRALADLGVPPAPILPGLRGAPAWPAGIVGSMTHCAGYRAAAVARAQAVATIGMDAEPHEPLPDGVFEMVASSIERDGIADLPAAPGICWDRILFCAKESTYKAWYPLTSRWLDFSEARITIDPDAGTFTSHLLVPGPTVGGRSIDGFDGRWLVDRGLILTTIVVAA